MVSKHLQHNISHLTFQKSWGFGGEMLGFWGNLRDFAEKKVLSQIRRGFFTPPAKKKSDFSKNSSVLNREAGSLFKTVEFFEKSKIVFSDGVKNPRRIWLKKIFRQNPANFPHIPKFPLQIPNFVEKSNVIRYVVNV